MRGKMKRRGMQPGQDSDRLGDLLPEEKDRRLIPGDDIWIEIKIKIGEEEVGSSRGELI
jgi:hypothetical protein